MGGGFLRSYAFKPQFKILHVILNVWIEWIYKLLKYN